MSAWPTDDRFRKFAALVADSCQLAMSHGQVIGLHCCPLGAVIEALRDRMVHGYLYSGQFPTCDESSVAMRKLGGGQADWIDECRAFEVGFDGEDPREECVSRRDPYYRLGAAYRERFQ